MGLLKKIITKILTPAAVKASTSKTPALTFISKGLIDTSAAVKTASGVAVGIGTAAVLAPAATLAVAKVIAPTAATIGTIALLAPKTTSAVLSSPEISKTVAAGLVNPYAGLIVGIEQGGGLLSTAISSASDATKLALGAGAGALLAGGLALGFSSLSSPSEGATSIIDTIGTTIQKITGKTDTSTADTSTGNQGVATQQGTADIIDNSGVITPQTQVLTKTATTKRKKKRLQARTANISQRVNIVMSQSQNKRYINKFVQSR
jgi:hypothetical protein